MKIFPPLTCEQLLEMSDHDRQTMARFAEITENCCGCMTPIEEFLLKQTRSQVEWGGGVTPDDIAADLDELRENFDTAIKIARLLVRQYPAQVLGEECGRWPQQAAKLKRIAAEFGAPGDDAELHAQSILDIARQAIREFPSLVLADKSWEEISPALRKAMAHTPPITS